MNSNNIHSIIATARSTGLRKLDLSNMSLTSLPPEIAGELPELEELNLAGNQITDISGLKSLVKLKVLDLDFNPVENIEVLADLQELTSLSLRKEAERRKIAQKNVNYQIQQSAENANFPAYLRIQPLESLKNLRMLWLDHQEIEGEETLNELHYLTLLSLNGMKIYHHNLFRLSELERLYLEETGLVELSFLNAFPKLKTLHLSGNYIEKLNGIEALTDLECLVLQGNQIMDISPLSALGKLSQIDISNNQIKDFSPLSHLIIEKKHSVVYAFPDATVLENSIATGGNPWEMPPLEIMNAGGDTLRNYLIEFTEKEQITNREIKLILVGNSTSGKSSLSKLLRTGQFDTQETTTHGIRSEEWRPGNSRLKVQVWDFGGQEYYHATHRLFLSSRAVYLVLWDRGTNEGGFVDTDIYYDQNGEPVKKTESLEHFPLAYWMDTIRFYARDSSIFTIQNKIDYYKPMDLPEGVRDTYEINPEHVVSLSVKMASDRINSESLEENVEDKYFLKYKLFETMLKEELLTNANTFSMSKYWKQVREEIEILSKSETQLSRKAFEEICKKYDSNPNPELVLFYLKEMTGLVLFFQDNETLKDKIFLRPNEIHASIYQILNYQIRENKGSFDLSHIQQILSCTAEESKEYAALMEQFELIFETEEGKFIAPQYLPHSLEPAQVQMIEQFMNLEPAFVLKLPGFIPRSLISRFISQKGAKAQKNIYWKFGILYQESNVSVLVHAHYRTRTISVSVQPAEAKIKKEILKKVWENLCELIGKPGEWEISIEKDAFIPLTDALKVEKTDESLFLPLTEIIQANKYGARTLLSKPWETEYFRFLLPPAAKKSTQVFIACAAGDEAEYKEILEKHLSLLVRKEVIKTWDVEDIPPGADKNQEIEKNIENAGIILLLVSAAFMADELIWEKVLQKVLQKYNSGESIVIPVYLRPCDISLWDFGGLEMLPSTKDANGAPVPVSKMDKDEAFLEVVNALRGLIFQ